MLGRGGTRPSLEGMNIDHPTSEPVSQIEFRLAGRSEDEVRQLLEAAAGYPVRVRWTSNRVSMISVRFPALHRAEIRMHEAFGSAPSAVLDALGHYLRTRRREDWRCVAAFARQIPARTAAVRPPPPVQAAGAVWDLAAIAAEVNTQFFSGRVDYRIGWGRRPATRRVRRFRRARSIRYGSWDATTRTIRIHPALDDGRVPREFVRYIVFHEMLHAVVPTEGHHGRRVFHPAAFRALERRYPDYPRMRQLARDMLRMLR